MSPTPCTLAADYRTDAPRVDGWTYQRQAAFLMALSETGLVSAACQTAEMSVASAYALRREARGRGFALGWQAAHLLARDRLEDVLLEAAITGVATVTERVEGTSVRRSLNGNLSMAVLNRLDKRAASLDDRAMAVARSIGAAFEAFLVVILEGGTDAAIDAFLAAHPDPLGPQVAAAAAARETAPAPIVVEKSASFYSVALPGQLVIDPITASMDTSVPCGCHDDQVLGQFEAA
jgi:hypothetical protein